MFYRFDVQTATLTAIVILCSLWLLKAIRRVCRDYVLFDENESNLFNGPFRTEHDKKRRNTYPESVTNTWYHLCDSKDVPVGKVVEIRALNQVFAIWRGSDGLPVCQDAFCLHLGANLAVGGKVVDDCLECPFHKWKFSNDGSIFEIPYISDTRKCTSTKKLKTYFCVDWSGLICVYFHADDKDPPFFPPHFVSSELKDGNWCPHLKWDIGFTTLSPIDWVDQAGDHAHFSTLHGEFLIPWTTLPIPQWLAKLFPMGICHQLVTYRGDDAEWAEKVALTSWGVVDKHLIFFTDKAGLTWKKKPITSSVSETIEMYCGPAIMSFHIPFTIGVNITFRIFYKSSFFI